MTIGTGGQVFAPLATPLFDPQLRLHTFCHAPDARWYLLGAMLSAGMALRWLRSTLGSERLSYAQMDKIAAEVEPGSEGLVFLPYLVGERSPLMDPNAKGTFIGLTLRHGPGHMVRALLEGVTFALRQIIDAMIGCGAELDRLVASGNGLASQLWRQMLADVLNRPLFKEKGQTRRRARRCWRRLDCRYRNRRRQRLQRRTELAPKFDAETAPNARSVRALRSPLSTLP